MTDIEEITPVHQRPLSEIVVSILASGIPLTDIHVTSDKEIMLRQSSYKWVPAEYQGKPIIASHDQIVSFLNGIFVGEEEKIPRKKEGLQWKDNLHKQGSLHPALNITDQKGEEFISYRMRCTIQKQMMGEAIGLVLRPLPDVPESLASLGLPFQIEKMLKSAYHGLIVVTGPTGSGKSRTMAAMIAEINRSRSGNILTIEDPVEYVHDRIKCIINQREVGIDVNSFAEGVHDALRFVPDVILIGEIRDAETMKAAIRAAESGHLVLASMHAPASVSAVRKILAYLSDSTADMQSLAYLLVGVVAQALVREKGDGGRNHLASEYLDCRNSKVVTAINQAASGHDGQKSLGALEKEIIGGSTDFSLSMLSSLKELLKKGLIDPQRAAAAVTTNDEKTALLNLKEVH